MKYELSQGTFALEKSQLIVELFLDTSYRCVIKEFGIREAKGLFETDSTLYDGYDMPYHIHILQGLIPAVQVFELKVIKEGEQNNPDYEIWLKVFCLGFLFHDANKLLEGSLLHAFKEIANNTEGWHEKLEIHKFFPEVDEYWGDIQRVALTAENRTSIGATLKAGKLPREVSELLDKIVRFADKMASMGGAIQYAKSGNGELIKTKEYSDAYQGARTMCNHIKHLLKDVLPDIDINYMTIQENLFKMMTKQALFGALLALQEGGRQILGITYNGIVFFGEPFNQELEERTIILAKEQEEVDVTQLLKVDFQTINLEFVSSKPLSEEIWEEDLMENQKIANKFLSMASNGKSSHTGNGYKNLKVLIELLKQSTFLDSREDEKTAKIYLMFTNTEEGEGKLFQSLVCLKKLRFLNDKKVKSWKNEFAELAESEEPFYNGWEWEVDGNMLQSPKEVVGYFKSVVKSPDNLLKTLFAIIWAEGVVKELIGEGAEDTIEELLDDVMEQLNPKLDDSEDDTNNQDAITELIKTYIDYPSKSTELWHRKLEVPIAEERCVQTNAIATEKYEEVKAFGLKARGYSRRAPSYLTTSPKTKISDMAITENQIRKKYFARNKEASLAVYRDFCEWGFGLPFQNNLLEVIATAKNITPDDQKIKIDNGAILDQKHHEYELLDIGKDIGSQFFFISKNIRFARELGIRCFITSIMIPYRSHKAIFHYENAPRFAKQLGWDIVRLSELNIVADEVSLLWELSKIGKNINSGYILAYAGDRNHIFRLYGDYAKRVEEKEKKAKTFISNTRQKIKALIKARPKYFTNMISMSKLAEIAVSIKQENKNASQESRIIRIALSTMKQAVRDNINDKEYIITMVAGALHKTFRLNPYLTDDKLRTASRAFAEQLFEMYENEWEGDFPAKTKEKMLIDQFAFIYAEKVADYFADKKQK